MVGDRVSRTVLVAAAGLGVVVVAPPIATAGPSSRANFATPATPGVAVPATAAPATSAGFAGYQLASQKITSTRADFVVPGITCKQNESGVGPSVITVSTVNKKSNTYTYSGGGVGVACENHEPVYESIIVVNGSTWNDFQLQAGDDITVTTTMKRSGSSVSFTDATNGDHKTRSGAGKAAAETYVGDNGLQINKRNVRLDPFSPTDVTAASIDGKSLSAMHAQRTVWKRGSTTLVAASPLTGKGRDFRLTFKHS